MKSVSGKFPPQAVKLNGNFLFVITVLGEDHLRQTRTLAKGNKLTPHCVRRDKFIIGFSHTRLLERFLFE